jgi:hypothetical protein
LGGSRRRRAGAAEGRLDGERITLHIRNYAAAAALITTIATERQGPVAQPVFKTGEVV